MQHQLVTSPERPSRAQIAPAALALLSRHSAGLLATARRYSASPEDAEDAYQRGVEILLTKAPTTAEDELLPWLRTVVKHEAFAVGKARGRALPSEDVAAVEVDSGLWTDERAERYERLRVGAEAMAGLKPQEIRCLLLKAEGLSYQEICSATGWTYTKVNRCLTEGRRAFLKRVAGIESGAECERLAPLISKAADGEASPDEMRQVRPHLKGCLACKATLREYRATPARVAGLVPPVAALAGVPGGGVLTRVLAALQDRVAGACDVFGAKATVMAASAVVAAGGGAATVDALDQGHPQHRVVHAARRHDGARPQVQAGPHTLVVADRPPVEPQPAPPARRARHGSPAPATTQTSSAPSGSSASTEFDPGVASPAPTSTSGASGDSTRTAPPPVSATPPPSRSATQADSAPAEFFP